MSLKSILSLFALAAILVGCSSEPQGETKPAGTTAQAKPGAADRGAVAGPGFTP